MDNNQQISVLREQLELMITVPNPKNVGAWSSEVKKTRNALFSLLDAKEINWEEENCAGYEEQRALKQEVNLLLQRWESVLDAAIPKAQPRSASAAQKPLRNLPEVKLPNDLEDLETIEGTLWNARLGIHHASSADSRSNLLDAVGQYCALLLQMNEEVLRALITKASYNCYLATDRQRAVHVSRATGPDDWISFAESISGINLNSFYPN